MNMYKKTNKNKKSRKLKRSNKLKILKKKLFFKLNGGAVDGVSNINVNQLPQINPNPHPQINQNKDGSVITILYGVLFFIVVCLFTGGCFIGHRASKNIKNNKIKNIEYSEVSSKNIDNNLSNIKMNSNNKDNNNENNNVSNNENNNVSNNVSNDENNNNNNMNNNQNDNYTMFRRNEGLDSTERLLNDLQNFKRTQDLLINIMNDSLDNSRRFINYRYGSYSDRYNEIMDKVIEGYQSSDSSTDTSTSLDTSIDTSTDINTETLLKNLQNKIKEKEQIILKEKIQNSIEKDFDQTIDKKLDSYKIDKIMNKDDYIRKLEEKNRLLRLDLTNLTSLREQNEKRNKFLEVLIVNLMKKQETLANIVRVQYQKEQNFTTKLQQVLEVNKMLQNKIDEIREEKKEVSKESAVLNNLGKKFKVIKLGPKMAKELSKMKLINNVPQEVRKNIKPNVLQVMKI